MLSVRLSVEAEKELTDYCERMRLPKSPVVKEALEIYLQHERTSSSPYELGVGLFGQEGSGQSEGSVTYKQQVREMINEKYSH